MKAILSVFIAASTLLLMTGCVSQAHYDELDLAYRESKEYAVELEQRIAELNQRVKALEQNPLDHQKQMAELVAQRDALAAKLTELQGKYEALSQRTPDVRILPQEVDQALKQFAEQNPGLVEYDAQRGMVKFRSDLTFGLGSDVVRNEAKATIAKLANILSTGAAKDYEARVVGHTDTVRIAKPETRAKHPTNWHLSVHRAIAVRDVLQSSGVTASRTSVAGHGPFRPIVANTATGAERNRRVEIYLVPMTTINDSFLNNAGAAPAPQPQPNVPNNDNSNIPLK